LLIAAASLIFLVIITPYLVRQNGDDANKRPVPEKGAITKELPKQPEQPATVSPPEPLRSVETGPDEATITPGIMKPREVQPAPQPVEPSPATVPRPPVAETPMQVKASAPEKVQTAKPIAEPAPKEIFSKNVTTSEAAVTAPQKGPANPKAKAEGQSPPSKTVEYAVQIGSVFTDKAQAQALLNDLSAKGYKGEIHTAAHSYGYFVTTGPVPQTKAYTLLEQMKIQGLNDTKVIKVAPHQ
jgi:hypothetical protein